MTVQNVSRVAEMLFQSDPLNNYYKGISELQAVLTRVCGQDAVLNWDNNDVAMFDMPGIRILLSLTESPYEGYVTRLVISVGPSPITAPQDRTTMVHASICVRIVNRLKAQCTPCEIRWNDIHGVVSADDIDKLSESDAQRQWAKSHPTTHAGRHATHPLAQTDLHHLRTVLHPYGPNGDLPAAWMRVANTSMDLAASLAVLPVAALQYAASWVRTQPHH